MARQRKPEFVPVKVWTLDMSDRLIKFIEQKREDTGRADGSKTAWSYRKLAKSAGMYPDRLQAYVHRDKVMSLIAMDSLMHALGISLIDLLQPHEIAAVLHNMDNHTRYTVKSISREQVSAEVAALLAQPIPQVVETAPDKDLDSDSDIT